MADPRFFAAAGPFMLSELAERTGAEIAGAADPALVLRDVAPLETAGPVCVASGHVKVPQIGRLLIGDDVAIGANSTIDRGAGPDTVVGDGTMIDNLVQIGHNVTLGRRCVIVAQVGISGSTSSTTSSWSAAKGGWPATSRSARARASRPTAA